MSLLYFAGDQTKAARIARDLVKELAPTDIEIAIENGLWQSNNDRLCSAIADRFAKDKTLMMQLETRIADKIAPELEPLFNKYSELAASVCSIERTASFNLGFAAAVRLLGVNGNGKKKK